MIEEWCASDARAAIPEPNSNGWHHKQAQMTVDLLSQRCCACVLCVFCSCHLQRHTTTTHHLAAVNQS